MIKIYLVTLTFFLGFYSFPQYCVTGVGSTSLIDSNIESVSLTGDVGMINYTGCPSVLGVEDQTTQSVTLTATNSYTLNVQFGTCGGNYPGSGEVWIDFNGNQIFEPTESVGTWAGAPPTAMSVFNFTVPASVSNLPVRMRVMQWEAGNLPLDPCGSYTWGSVVDFTINFTGGIDCSTYMGNDETDPRIISALPFNENYNNFICYTNNNPVYNSPDVYYLYVSQSNSEVITASLCGSSYDTYISAYDTQGNNLAFNDDACGPQSEIEIDLSNVDSVYIIVEGWGNESGDYTLNVSENTAGISSNNNNIELITIYPNPTNGTFKVKGISQSEVSIIDLKGKVLNNFSNYNGEIIDVSHLPKGIYFIRVTKNNSIKTEKLIIQ